MELRGRTAVVTGGGNGIGRAIARRFAADGAKGVVVVDLDGDAAAAVATELGDVGLGLAADVSTRAENERIVAEAEAAFGPVDVFVANAGIGTGAGLEADDEVWDRIWAVNVMAHVHAARAVVPGMVERGEGYVVTTASAAGLLSQIGDAPYSVTKHAAVAFAEWLAITYGDRGLRVSCLCPQGVRTNLLLGGAGQQSAEVVLAQGALEPEQVADDVVAAMADERFLILPHPEVAEYLRRKATDPDRWLAGMRRLQARFTG
jgi:NAD(P)-dependent dehydrogenase (short-subunit alcohol dehydrogenase family)